MTSIAIRHATPGDLPAIRAILNQAILETTAVWYDAPRSASDMQAWFDERRAADYPILVAVEGEAVLGYVACGPFRPHQGYAATAEHSIYIAPHARGRGLGRTLLDAIEAAARARGLHVLVGGLDADNAASLALHAKAGFVETARMPQVGRKFDRWLTLVFVQKTIGHGFVQKTLD